MSRSVWKGSIAFGLVSIPVEMHTAVRDHRPKFRMLHARDKSPVRYERVCQRDGKAVAWEDLVKGFEYEKGRFVVITKEDLKAAALRKDRAIDIMDFVKRDEIDDRYFETLCYLTPQKGSSHAYTDEYRDNLTKLIKARIKGEAPGLPSAEPRHDAARSKSKGRKKTRHAA